MNTDLNSLIEVAQHLADKARSDPSLAERLLADPAAVISAAAGAPIPEAIHVSAQRNDDGSIALTAAKDPAHTGELDDSLLELVAGGSSVNCDEKSP